MKEALFYTKEDLNVHCGLCRHSCVIFPGNIGFCGVRKNVNGKLYSTNYGKISATNVDPIEKKPLYHFLPFSDVFSVGSFGCNFKCDFCQNWDISQFTRDTVPILPNEIIKKVKTPSIAFTYNEPTIFYEYAYDVAKLAHAKKIKNIFVTNGYIEEEPLNKISKILDGANIDFKAFSNSFYQKVCRANFDKFLESLEVWAKTKVWIEFTNLLIPGENDGEQIKQMCQFIKDKFGSETPLHFSSYYPTYKRKTKATTLDLMEEAYSVAKDVGLKYVYLGNILTDKINTYCYNCNELLVDRINKQINVKENKCPSCNKKQWFVFQ